MRRWLSPGSYRGCVGGDIDYAMLIKLYGAAPETAKGRYSPAECIGSRKVPVEGNPDPRLHQYVIRRAGESDDADAHAPLTRLTNACSKKVENRAYSMALFTTYYNFVRIHAVRRENSVALFGGLGAFQRRLP